MKTITLFAREWRDSFHVAYFTCRIFVDGRVVTTLPYQAGHGQQYEHEACKWLFKRGHLPGWNPGGSKYGEALWRYCERKNIDLHREKVVVARKKDLH
jgi:hypothetical protein